jgi:hypothetical protein
MRKRTGNMLIVSSQCITVASRPLRGIEELAEFLAIDLDADQKVAPSFVEHWHPRDTTGILSTCTSLIAVVDVHGTRIVLF